MVNYQNGKIYKIICDKTNTTYYGSTTQLLCKRLHGHKTQKNCMVKNMTNPKIYLIELCPCNTKEELQKRERYFIENNECINKNIPLRTNKEWRQVNKEDIKEKAKEYYEKNKDILDEKNKLYYEKNKDKMKEYRENNKDKMKEYYQIYYEKNKEKKKQQAKEYREKKKKNKE